VVYCSYSFLPQLSNGHDKSLVLDQPDYNNTAVTKCKELFCVIFKEFSGLQGVFANFFLQSIQVGEFLLASQESEKLQGQVLAVKVTVEVQDPGFHGDPMTAYSGSVADVCDSQIGDALYLRLAGVHTEGEVYHILRNGEIGSGNSQGSA